MTGEVAVSGKHLQHPLVVGADGGDTELYTAITALHLIIVALNNLMNITSILLSWQLLRTDTVGTLVSQVTQ